MIFGLTEKGHNENKSRKLVPFIMSPYDFQAVQADTKDTRSISNILEHCRSYQGADTRRSVLQLFTTMALFIATLAVMGHFFNSHYLITILLMPVAAGLLTRLFIFQHDCEIISVCTTV